MQFLHSTKALVVAMTERRRKEKNELLLIVRVLQMGSGLNSLFTLSIPGSVLHGAGVKVENVSYDCLFLCYIILD